jgi:hypothetical protein
VKRPAAHYDYTTIALIISKQHRRTATGLTWTKTRVKALRVSYGIPAHRDSHDVGQTHGAAGGAKADRP